MSTLIEKLEALAKEWEEEGWHVPPKRIRALLAANAKEGEPDREGFYEKLWKDFCSLQRGSAQGVVARVEQYYRDHPEGALSASAAPDALREKMGEVLRIATYRLDSSYQEKVMLRWALLRIQSLLTAALARPAPAATDALREALEQITHHGDGSGVIACSIDYSFYVKPMQDIAQKALDTYVSFAPRKEGA